MYKIISKCKGGGYKYCRTEPLHPKSNSKGLYSLHRVLMENKLNRDLLSSEEVPHKDGDKSNNLMSNLEVLTKSEHAKIHNPKIKLIPLECPKCEKIFSIKPLEFRLRKKRNKSNKVFCSSSCATKFTKH